MKTNAPLPTYPTLHRLGLFALLASSGLLQAQSIINVPGTSTPWLAGMPDGTSASFNLYEPADIAPAQSPVLALTLAPGQSIRWTASGLVGHPGHDSGPDGATVAMAAHLNGAEHGISDITVPIVALVGVFLGPLQPDSSPAPAALDFSTAGSWDYVTLFPALQQVFFMGDGVTSWGSIQTVHAPAGATRLFLGTMDGYGWSNNTGAFSVTLAVVPEPRQSTLLGALGLGVLAVWRRWRS